jgi:hypothetical protein
VLAQPNGNYIGSLNTMRQRPSGVRAMIRFLVVALSKKTLNLGGLTTFALNLI